MDSPSLYRDTLKRAWNITRNHTHIWVLGFLAALLGNGGEFEFIFTQFNQLSDGTISFGQSILTTLGTGGSNMVQFLVGALTRSQDNYLLLGGITFVLLLAVWLVVSAQGALIRAVAAAGSGSGQGSLSTHFNAGSDSFWQLLAIILATRIGAFFVLAVLGIPLFALLAHMFGLVKPLFLVVFVLGVPLLIIASLIAKFAIAFRMLEHKKWRTAITSSLSLFFDHWLISIELALVLFVINIMAGAAIILVILIFAFPFILLSYFVQSVASTVFLWIGQVLALLLLILLGSILATFQYASWTELFLKIRRGKHVSKIVRMVMHVREKYH